jgi:hypothetical protein
MTQLKTKIFLILIGSILATGLHGMGPHSQSWAEYLLSFIYNPKPFLGQVSGAFAPHVRKCVTLAKKDMAKKDPYLDHVRALRDMVLDKRNRGELPSIGGAQHADVKSIDMHVVNAEHLSLATCELKKKVTALRYNIASPLFTSHDSLSKSVGRWSLAYGLKSIKEETSGICCKSTSNEPVILLKSGDSYVEAQDRRTFHELAHALDACLKDNENGLDCYHWLKDDVKNYDLKEIALREWHADKQAISWLKKYNTDQAQELIELYELCKRHEVEGAEVPKYAPISVRLAWLRDPKV